MAARCTALALVCVAAALGCGGDRHVALAADGGGILRDDGEAVFQDAALDSAVTSALVRSGTTLDLAGLRTLTQLSAVGCGIADLSGVETMRALAWLDLSRNRVADLPPWKGCRSCRSSTSRTTASST